MLVLFIGYVLYFIAAVFYKRRQGERGMDQIPNIEFWRRLFGRFRGSSSRQQYRNVGASGGVGDYHITLVDDDELFSE